MKFIIKNQEPKEFTEWKSSKRGTPTWKKIPTPIKNIIRENLKKEQGYICAYCEIDLIDNESHTDHIKPQGKKYYPELQLDYNNLVASCQNNLIKGEPRRCGVSRGSWYDEELFITPFVENCDNRFRFYHDGQISANLENDIQQ